MSLHGWVRGMFGGLLFAMFLGCHQKTETLPTLYPVTGIVLDHGKPVTGGHVRFSLEDSQEALIVESPVSKEGKFELTTMKGRTKAAGAPEGTYRITYQVSNPGKGVMPIVSRKTYQVEAKANELTLEVGKENEF